MKLAFTIILLLLLSGSYAQQRKTYFPVWTFHQNNINVNGVSVGIGSVRGVPKNTNTNGIKIEIIGAGILVPLIPTSPISQTDSAFQSNRKTAITEHINGLSLSAGGTVCDCNINGITAGMIGQIEYKVNGISAALFANFAEIHNGIQASMFNESYRMSGLQIGLVNSSKRTRGIQIGIWNVNEHRKLPIINWSFN